MIDYSPVVTRHQETLPEVVEHPYMPGEPNPPAPIPPKGTTAFRNRTEGFFVSVIERSGG